MKVRLTRDLPMPMAKKGGTFYVKSVSTDADGKGSYFVDFYGNSIAFPADACEVVEQEADGKARLASEDDPRILPIGRLLRATRLDELPQIYNILKGDMSIVGPRPERPELAAELEKEIPEFSFRLQVKAGLTGYAQVYGKYNTTPYDKLKLDLTYIRNYSVLEDLKLIIMTPKIMLMKESTEGVKEEQEPTNGK